MQKLIGLAVILLGWLLFTAMLLTLAYLRSRWKSFIRKGFRSGKGSRSFDIRVGTCHTSPDRQIPGKGFDKLTPSRERGTQRGGVKAASAAGAN